MFLFFTLHEYSITYFTTSGNNNNSPGTNTANAWRTIGYVVEKTKSGDIIYVKVGTYGKEQINFSSRGFVL